MILRIRRAIEEKDEGFTLIELLVVVIIIGILAAIAIPIFLNQRKSAVDAGVESDLRNLATNIETYASANQGEYPDAADVAQVAGTDQVEAGSDAYIVVISNADTQIRYGVAADNTAFALCAYNSVAGNTANDSAFQYASGQGGVLPDKGACVATTAINGITVGQLAHT